MKPNSKPARWYNYLPQTGGKIRIKRTSSGSSGEYHFLPKIQRHPTSYRLQCWDTSCKTSNKAGTQPHSSAHRLSEYSPAHQKEQPQLYLPVGRNKILHQEACASLSDSDSLIQGDRQQKQKELQSCSLQKRNHNHRKLDKIGCRRICPR